MKNYGNGFCLLQLIERHEFYALCKKWEMDRYVRKFPTWNQLSVLILSYVLKVESSREVELVFRVPKSTFCDANQERAAGFFEELCRIILWAIHAQIKARKIRRAIRTVLALDSTECAVHGSMSRLPFWRHRKGSKKSSVKLHCIWDVEGEWIEDFRITPGSKNDSPVAKKFQITAGKTYVFDKAYNDLEFWQRIISKGSHFVTRLKKCSRRKYRHFDVLKGKEEESGVLWDGKWKPSHSAIQLRRRSIPKNFSVRHIIYRDPEQKRLFDFVTSDFSAPAQEIADIYKKRWAVELLFRWLKGHLNVRYFAAKNPNSIRVHVAVAVLVQLLVQLHRLKNSLPGTLWEALRRLRTELWEKGLLNLASAGVAPARSASGNALQP